MIVIKYMNYIHSNPKTNTYRTYNAYIHKMIINVYTFCKTHFARINHILRKYRIPHYDSQFRSLQNKNEWLDAKSYSNVDILHTMCRFRSLIIKRDFDGFPCDWIGERQQTNCTGELGNQFMDWKLKTSSIRNSPSSFAEWHLDVLVGNFVYNATGQKHTIFCRLTYLVGGGGLWVVESAAKL